MSTLGKGGRRPSKYDSTKLERHIREKISMASTGHLAATLVLRLEGDSEVYNFEWTPNQHYLDVAYRMVVAFMHLTEREQETTIDRLIQFLCMQQRGDTSAAATDSGVSKSARLLLGLECTEEDFAKIGVLGDLGDRYSDMGIIYLLDPTNTC